MGGVGQTTELPKIRLVRNILLNILKCGVTFLYL